MSRRIISLIICLSFLFTQTGFAQAAAVELNLGGYFARMGSNLTPIDSFRPMHLRYFSYDQLNNSFKVLLDKGDSLKGLSPKGTVPVAKLQTETKQLLNYFLVGVTLPNDTFWVNLRPDSPDSIIDSKLELTDIGKIMLETDLQLKKDTAIFTSPQTIEGKEYWNKLYKKAEELYGTDTVTIPTLTRPWIVPGEIIVRETKDSAYIYNANLKVLLEQDYLKSAISSQSSAFSFKDERSKALNEYSTQLIRELIIPKLTKEVNTAKRYASLRQVYYSLILSRWFKSRFAGKEGAYPALIDKQDLSNLTSKQSWTKDTYFQAYKKSFADGEYNIKEPVYTPTGQVIRSYFSGGENFAASALMVPMQVGSPASMGVIPAVSSALKIGDLNIGQLFAGNAGDPLVGLSPVAVSTQAGSPVKRKTPAYILEELDNRGKDLYRQLEGQGMIKYGLKNEFKIGNTLCLSGNTALETALQHLRLIPINEELNMQVAAKTKIPELRVTKVGDSVMGGYEVSNDQEYYPVDLSIMLQAEMIAAMDLLLALCRDSKENLYNTFASVQGSTGKGLCTEARIFKALSTIEREFKLRLGPWNYGTTKPTLDFYRSRIEEMLVFLNGQIMSLSAEKEDFVALQPLRDKKIREFRQASMLLKVLYSVMEQVGRERESSIGERMAKFIGLLSHYRIEKTKGGLGANNSFGYYSSSFEHKSSIYQAAYRALHNGERELRVAEGFAQVEIASVKTSSPVGIVAYNSNERLTQITKNLADILKDLDGLLPSRMVLIIKDRFRKQIGAPGVAIVYSNVQGFIEGVISEIELSIRSGVAKENGDSLEQILARLEKLIDDSSNKPGLNGREIVETPHVAGAEDLLGSSPLTLGRIFEKAQKTDGMPEVITLTRIAKIYGGSITPEMKDWFASMATAVGADVRELAREALEALGDPDNTARMRCRFWLTDKELLEKAQKRNEYDAFFDLLQRIERDPMTISANPEIEGWLAAMTTAVDDELRRAAIEAMDAIYAARKNTNTAAGAALKAGSLILTKDMPYDKAHSIIFDRLNNISRIDDQLKEETLTFIAAQKEGPALLNFVTRLLNDAFKLHNKFETEGLGYPQAHSVYAFLHEINTGIIGIKETAGDVLVEYWNAEGKIVTQKLNEEILTFLADEIINMAKKYYSNPAAKATEISASPDKAMTNSSPASQKSFTDRILQNFSSYLVAKDHNEGLELAKKYERNVYDWLNAIKEVTRDSNAQGAAIEAFVVYAKGKNLVLRDILDEKLKEKVWPANRAALREVTLAFEQELRGKQINDNELTIIAEILDLSIKKAAQIMGASSAVEMNRVNGALASLKQLQIEVEKYNHSYPLVIEFSMAVTKLNEIMFSMNKLYAGDYRALDELRILMSQEEIYNMTKLMLANDGIRRNNYPLAFVIRYVNSLLKSWEAAKKEELESRFVVQDGSIAVDGVISKLEHILRQLIQKDKVARQPAAGVEPTAGSPIDAQVGKLLKEVIFYAHQSNVPLVTMLNMARLDISSFEDLQMKFKQGSISAQETIAELKILLNKHFGFLLNLKERDYELQSNKDEMLSVVRGYKKFTETINSLERTLEPPLASEVTSKTRPSLQIQSTPSILRGNLIKGLRGQSYPKKSTFPGNLVRWVESITPPFEDHGSSFSEEDTITILKAFVFAANLMKKESMKGDSSQYIREANNSVINYLSEMEFKGTLSLKRKERIEERALVPFKYIIANKTLFPFTWTVQRMEQMLNAISGVVRTALDIYVEAARFTDPEVSSKAGETRFLTPQQNGFVVERLENIKRAVRQSEDLQYSFENTLCRSMLKINPRDLLINNFTYADVENIISWLNFEGDKLRMADNDPHLPGHIGALPYYFVPIVELLDSESMNLKSIINIIDGNASSAGSAVLGILRNAGTMIYNRAGHTLGNKRYYETAKVEAAITDILSGLSAQDQRLARSFITVTPANPYNYQDDKYLCTVTIDVEKAERDLGPKVALEKSSPSLRSGPAGSKEDGTAGSAVESLTRDEYIEIISTISYFLRRRLNEAILQDTIAGVEKEKALQKIITQLTDWLNKVNGFSFLPAEKGDPTLSRQQLRNIIVACSEFLQKGDVSYLENEYRERKISKENFSAIFNLVINMPTITFGINQKSRELLVLAITSSLRDGIGISSSPATTGGISFRPQDMRIKYEPMGSLQGLNFKLPTLSYNDLKQMNLALEAKSIKQMIAGGMTPSGQRIKEFMAACCQKQQLSDYQGEVAVWLVEACRLDEQEARDSAPELKEAIVILENIAA